MSALAEVVRIGGVARLCASVATCALLVRFAGLALEQKVSEELPQIAPSAAALPASAPTTAPTVAALPSAPVSRRGTSLRIPLVVAVGPDRARVIVNGAPVGNAPYVGEVSCKAGESVVIQIVPERGPPAVHQRTCALGTLRISEP